MTHNPLRVAVIGAGAVGCYYGGRLAEVGHDVAFLMRRDYDAVRERGLVVHSCDGDFHLPRPTVVRRSEEIGAVDWVICALKATSLDEARGLIAPCLGPSTRVLLIMNGLGLEDVFGAWFGRERVFAGLAFTCINRGEPGVVHHMRYGALNIAHLQDDAAELAEAASLWAGAKVSVSTAPSLLQARWEKLCWNIPFNGMTIAAGGVPTDRVLAQEDLAAETQALMAEVVAIGNAALAASGVESRIDGPGIIERMFRFTATMGDYHPSTLIDFLEGKPLEVEAIFGEPQRWARELGVEAPRLAMLTALLRSLGGRRAGAAEGASDGRDGSTSEGTSQPAG